MANPQQDQLIESCQRFIQMWEQNSPDGYAKRKRINERRDFICLDQDNGPDSWSGVFMVRKADGQVFGIKAYGRVNLRKPCGYIDQFVIQFSDNRSTTR